jgi:hypothetical protein
MSPWHVAALVCFALAGFCLYGMISNAEATIPFFVALSVASLFCGFMGYQDLARRLYGPPSQSTVIQDSFNTVHHHHHAAQAAQIEELRKELIKLQRRHIIAEIEHQPVIVNRWLDPIHEDINRPAEILVDDHRAPPPVKSLWASIIDGALDRGEAKALPAPKPQSVALVRAPGQAVTRK